MSYQVILSDALLLTIPNEMVPEVDLPEGLEKIQSPTRHITLVSQRGISAMRHHLDSVDLEAIAPPTPQLGTPSVVYRAPKEDRPEMACLTAPVVNQEEFRAFVNDLFKAWGLRNPEPKFFYHLTLANNADGNPRGSICYNKASDFQGPESIETRVFKRRANLDAVDKTPSIRLRGP